jgi:hypothetical protein
VEKRSDPHPCHLRGRSRRCPNPHRNSFVFNAAIFTPLPKPLRHRHFQHPLLADRQEPQIPQKFDTRPLPCTKKIDFRRYFLRERKRARANSSLYSHYLPHSLLCADHPASVHLHLKIIFVVKFDFEKLTAYKKPIRSTRKYKNS